MESSKDGDFSDGNGEDIEDRPDRSAGDENWDALQEIESPMEEELNQNEHENAQTSLKASSTSILILSPLR